MSIEVCGGSVYYRGDWVGWVSDGAIFHPCEDCPREVVDYFYGAGFAIRRKI